MKHIVFISIIFIFLFKGPALAEPLLHPPLLTLTVTSPYGVRRDPISGRIKKHRGVDLKASYKEPVFSVLPGKVIFSGPYKGYGNLVVISHDSGLITRYAHLESVTCYPGDFVKAGEKIGKAGASGRATGTHLHFEFHLDGAPVNPMPLFETDL